MVSAIAITFLFAQVDSLLILLVSASTSWLLAYMVAHINVLVLRKRYPYAKRPYRTPFFPLPQILGLAGMAFVAINNSPSPEMAATVYKITGGILLGISLFAAYWVHFVMRRGLFEAEDL